MTPTDDRTSVLRADRLTKSFASHLSLGRRRVVEEVSLEVRRGEIYGLLGPNGAGKTTTLKMILGLLRPDRGQVALFGLPVGDPASRRRVGFLPESPWFYDYLTATEFLDFYGRLLGLTGRQRRDRVGPVLKKVGLEEAPSLPLRKFSKGMIQRIGLAQALLGEPELLVLDEPMSGLDPIGRRAFRDLILEQKRAGTTILFSSHILQDAEMLCDRVGILRAGRLVREGDLASLREPGVRAFEVTLAGVRPPSGEGWIALGVQGEELLLRVEGGEALGRLLGAALGEGIPVVRVTPLRMTLEEIFLREVGGTR